MADDLGMDQYDDPTILGLLEKGPRGYRVISVQDHGNGDLDPFCRENIVKRAIRTRLTDQEIAYVFGRGGDTVYLVMNTGEPDTYEVGKGQWVLGEEVPEAQGVEQLRALKVEGTNTNLLTNEQIEAIVQGQEAPGLKKVLMKDRDKYIEKYFVEINNREGYMTSRYISTKKTETRFDLNAQGNLEVRLRDAEKALETPELSAATMQAERRNHHMVSVLRAQRKLRNLHRKRRKQRSELVEYPMTGCSPKGRPEDDNDRRGWRDAEYRSAIRQRRGKKDPFGLRQKRGRDLPLGLYYRNERYMVRIGNLDIDGLRVLAHNEAERESRTSKEAYEQLMEALVHKMVRGNEEEQLQACEIMARYGENGLRTGSNQFYQEIFGLREGHREGSDSFWIYPDQQARGRAWQRPHDPNGGYAYEPLYRRMQRVLHAAYHKDPAVTPVDEYNPFWTEKEFENRYGQTWYTIDLQDPNKRHAHKAALDLQEDFIAANFDRTMPSEQYRFRKTLSQLFGAHDKKSYRSKSRALRRVMELTIHIISLPTVSWHYEPDGKGGGEWKLEIDWSTFDYFAEGIEAFRDWVRMIAEWQQTKAMLNAYAAMSFTRQIADQGRTRDFGGIWNSVPIWQCWAYRLLYWYANSRPSVLDEHGMPQFDASGNRLWKRRAPMPIQPTRERPKRLPGETWGEWQARLTVWESRYPDAPTRPTRNPNEDDVSWMGRLRDYKRQLKEWSKEVDKNLAEDLDEYKKAINARVAIMGWAWHDRDPMADMPHDGVLRALSVYRWADWLDMITIARGFNSQLGEGLVPDHAQYLKEQSSKVRNYRNETEALESDEGALYDPQAFWDYLGAIIRDHVLNFLNYRLSGTFSSSPALTDVLFDGTDVYRETATMVRNQLMEMWQNIPIKGIKLRILKLWDDSVNDNVIHIRPVIKKFLDGLPAKVIEELQPLIRGLNRRSDRRIRLWAQHLSVGRGGGKRAFSMSQRFIDEGYGLNTGEQLTEKTEDENGRVHEKLLSVSETEQKRQDDLGFMGWMNQQYDKAAPFVRGLVLRERTQLFVDAKENAEHVIKAVEGGLYVEIAWELIEIASERGLFLKTEDFFPSLKKFREEYKHTGIEQKFETRCKDLLGTEEFRAMAEGYLFPEMRAADDPGTQAAA